jgi:hypothetical protein
LLITATVCAGIGTIAATGLATRWLHPAAPQAPLLGAATMAGVTILADLGLLSLLSWRLASFHELCTGWLSRQRSSQAGRVWCSPAAPAGRAWLLPVSVRFSGSRCRS